MLLSKPMWAWHIPRWAIPAALGGVLAIAGADAVLLLRRHPVSVRPRATPEAIGLRADAEGEGLRVQWDRRSRPVLDADHATLYIADGTLQSHLDLTGRQLDSSSVMYWPESDRVGFRLEVYRGSQSTSESAVFAPVQARNRRRRAGPARAIVEQARPSPFDRKEPAITEAQSRPVPVIAPLEPLAAPESPAVEPPQRSRLDRMIGRIPLLRRFRKHPPADGTQPR